MTEQTMKNHFGISIFIILLKAPILFLIQSSFNTSFATQSLIKEYVSVRLYSAPAELSIYVLVGLYLGLQKTKISSLLITFFCLSNIILSMIFVIYLDLEIYGVALGTLISAYLTVGISILGSFYYFNNEEEDDDDETSEPTLEPTAEP